MVNKKSTTNTNYPRLLKVFKEEISSNLIKQNNLTSPMQVPRILKIVLNMGVGQAVNDKKILEKALGDMEKIAGQKPIPTRAKNSVAGFKIRKGYAIGCKVTLRGKRMYEFLDRLVTVALPRVRDFQGVKSTGFDGRGNYNLGVTEQIIFPEIDIDKVNKIGGMDITFVTNAKTDKEAKSLLNELGLPFKKN